MDGKCTECGCNNVALHHYHKNMCYDCYEKMYYNVPVSKSAEDESDFELKHDTAIISVSGIADGSQVMYMDGNMFTFKIPKQMVFDSDCRVKDYDKLILFLLENMTIYDNAKGFDKVKYMFKEVKK